MLALQEASLVTLFVCRAQAARSFGEPAHGHVLGGLVGINHRVRLALLPLSLLVHEDELGQVGVWLRQVKRLHHFLLPLFIATQTFAVEQVLLGRVKVVWVLVRALAAFGNRNISRVGRGRPNLHHRRFSVEYCGPQRLGHSLLSHDASRRYTCLSLELLAGC